MEKDVVLNLHLSEDDTNTLAFATLDLRGDHFEALGSSKRNPIDPPMPVSSGSTPHAWCMASLASATAQPLVSTRNGSPRSTSEISMCAPKGACSVM